MLKCKNERGTLTAQVVRLEVARHIIRKRPRETRIRDPHGRSYGTRRTLRQRSSRWLYIRLNPTMPGLNDITYAFTLAGQELCEPDGVKAEINQRNVITPHRNRSHF